MGYDLWQTWIAASVVLYVLQGSAGSPIVVLQIRMRDIATEAVTGGRREVAGARYWRLSRLWFWLGCRVSSPSSRSIG